MRVGRARRGATPTGDRRTDSSIRLPGDGQPIRGSRGSLAGPRSTSVSRRFCLQSRPGMLLRCAHPPHHATRSSSVSATRPRGLCRHTETSRRALLPQALPLLHDCDDRFSMAPDRPGRRIAGQTPPPAPAPHARGGFVHSRVDTARCAPARVMWIHRSPAAVAQCAFTHHARGGGGAARARGAARGHAPSPFPPHLGVAGAQRERLARRPPGLRHLGRPAAVPDGAPYWSHTGRGRRRHARSHQVGACWGRR